MTDPAPPGRPPISPGKPPAITKPAQAAQTRVTTKPNRAVHGLVPVVKGTSK